MKPLFDIINSQKSGIELTPAQKRHLLSLDRKYGELMELYRADRNWKDPLNIEEEREKFMKARANGEKYYPLLKFEKCKFTEDGILKKMQDLLIAFENFDCFLSKYYIENLRNYIFRVKYTIRKTTNDPKATYYGNNGFDMQVSDEMYSKALDAIKNHPYESLKDAGRDIDAATAAKEIKQCIDDKGYGWEIVMCDNMMPRMNVNTDRKMRINKNAMFSKEDIEGLKAHEVDAHIGKRYYGYMTGLNLFVHGLNGRNILDEGLAIWNSLNKVEHPKKNIIFNSALKTAVIYNVNRMDFCELFDFVKSIAPQMPDNKVFSLLCRAKREIHDMRLLGAWTDDASYFVGYQLVDAMTDTQRDDILKYNIGPSQIDDLPEIKRFLETNKFKPLI